MALNSAPGFIDLETLFDHRVTEVGWNVINDAIVLSTQLHTAAVSSLLATVAEPLTVHQERFFMPMITELQPLQGEFDSPRPVGERIAYDRAYPLRDGGFAWGTNRKSRAKMTVSEANDFTLAGLRADARWLVRHLLSAWFTNTVWTFDDQQWGNLTIGCLANGDSQEYLNAQGDTFTDDHFLAQVNAISDTDDPFPIIYSELSEHPENVGDFVAYVPTNLVTAVSALADFVPAVDRDIAPALTTARLLTDVSPTSIGDRLLGKHESGIYVVEWRRLPDNYILFHDTSAPFIGMRQEPETELQGLRVEVQDVDGNMIVSRLLRTAGFAARNRIAAGVYQIGSASYAIPTGYDAPLAV